MWLYFKWSTTRVKIQSHVKNDDWQITPYFSQKREEKKLTQRTEVLSWHNCVISKYTITSFISTLVIYLLMRGGSAWFVRGGEGNSGHPPFTPLKREGSYQIFNLAPKILCLGFSYQKLWCFEKKLSKSKTQKSSTKIFQYQSGSILVF